MAAEYHMSYSNPALNLRRKDEVARTLETLSKASTILSSAESLNEMSDDLCVGFLPQAWNRERCKRCFRLRDAHRKSSKSGTSPTTNTTTNTNTNSTSPHPSSSTLNSNVTDSPVLKRGSWRDKVYGATTTTNSSSTTGGMTSTSNVSRRGSTSSTTSSTHQASTSATNSTSTTTKTTIKPVASRPSTTAARDPSPPETSATFSIRKSSDFDRAKSPSSLGSTAEFKKENSPKKLKMVVLRAEVSVDDGEAEDIAMETTIQSDTPNSSAPPSRRSESPTEEVMSFRSAHSGGERSSEASTNLYKTASFESLSSTNLETKSMVTAMSGGSDEEGASRSSTPTEQFESHAEMRSIQAQLEIMEQKCATLESENAQLRGSQASLNTTGVVPSSSSQPTSSTNNYEYQIRDLKEKLSMAESLTQDYKQENTVLKCELGKLQETLSKNTTKDSKKLTDKLKAAEQLCEEMMEENERLKKEVNELQNEIEELQDQYREEEIEEFRDLQRELEQTAKNCRILQFKLRKTERVKDQTEADRQHLETKVKEIAEGRSDLSLDLTDTRRVKELESELRIAKEVSVRLHNELEALEDKRCKLEDSNFFYKEKIREVETREKLMEASKQKYAEKKSNRSGLKENRNSGDYSDYNIPQLLRDLQDAVEKEHDMRDQLRFAEEDLAAHRKKLSDLETENDGMSRQLSKLTSGNGGRGGSGKAPMKRSMSEGQTQIQLELAEHEAAALKNRLEKSEKESEAMGSRIALLEKELNKMGGNTDFSEEELRSAVPDTYYKQKIKMLEEEVEELKATRHLSSKTEADQDPSWTPATRRQRFAVKSRSLEHSDGQSSSASSDPPSMDLKRQLALSEQEMVILRKRITALESENSSLMKNKSPGSSAAVNGVADGGEKAERMQKDIDKFIARISELERQKEALSKEVERRKRLDEEKAAESTSTTAFRPTFNPQKASPLELREKVTELLKDNTMLMRSSKTMNEKHKELEDQLADYKGLILQSENQQLVTMATKVEVTNSQLRESNERFSAMHRRLTNDPGSDKNYSDTLKAEIEKLEAELVEERLKNGSRAGSSPSASAPTKGSDVDQPSVAADYQELIETVQKQADRIYSQIEQLASAQKSGSKLTGPSPVLSRYRGESGSKTSSSGNNPDMLNDVLKIKDEMSSLTTKLKKKISQKSGKQNGSVISNEELESLRQKCSQQEKANTELREQLELASQEKDRSTNDCDKATQRLLQTEQRWNKELEKLKETYENQVKDLKYYLEEAERSRDEKGSLLNERSTTLTEKQKKVDDLEAKLSKIDSELRTKTKQSVEKMEGERKRANEFETKYIKLEQLYETDRSKVSAEREKFKTEALDLKKKYEDAMAQYESCKTTMERKQNLCTKEKEELHNKLKKLESSMKESEKSMSKKANEMASSETKKLEAELADAQRRLTNAEEEYKREKAALQSQIDSKHMDVECRTREEDRMKKEISLFKSRIDEQRQQLEETRRARDESREELSRWQQTWARERSELAHKLRQEEKVQQAEQQALQLKYENRIKVMEESSRRFQSQLTQSRRERDHHRENLAVSEKKMAEIRLKFEEQEKLLKSKITKMEKKIEMVDDLSTDLEKLKLENATLRQTSDTDRRLWTVEKEEMTMKMSNMSEQHSVTSDTSSGSKEQEGRLKEAMKIASELRKQVDDSKKKYETEIKALRKQIDKSRQDNAKERSDLDRRLREAQESVKVLEIDRRNFLSNKDDGEQEKNELQSERDVLLQRIHDSEIHQLANKYKLDKVADQLSDLSAKVRYTDGLAASDKKDMDHLSRKALDQLMAVRDDMNKTRELGKSYGSDPIDPNADKISISSWRSQSSSSRRDDDVSLASRERLDVDSGYSMRKSGSSTSAAGPSSNQSTSLMDSSRSVSTEDNWEARISEFRRLRSPSPSPRKITNYPDPPPTMILNSRTRVEYNRDGTRSYARRHFRRSISLEQGTNYLTDPTGGGGAGGSSLLLPYERSMQTSTSDLSSSIDRSPRERRRVKDIFGSLTKSKRETSEESITSSVSKSGGHHEEKGKRKLFSYRKSRSVETSDTGHTIGAMGVSVMSPGVTAGQLPESVTNDETSSSRSGGGRVKKSGSGTSLFDRIRRGSSNKSLNQSKDESVMSSSSSAQAPPLRTMTQPVVSSSRAVSVSDVRSKLDTKTRLSFNRLSTSSSSVSRSLSNRYLKRF